MGDDAIFFQDDKLLAAELVEVLKADATFAGHFQSLLVGQEGEIRHIPALILFGEYANYPANRKGTLNIIVRSAAGGTEHSSLFAAVYARFLGNPEAVPAVTPAAAQAALIAAVTARGRVQIAAYGPRGVEASVDGNYLHTVLTLNIAWKFL